ncbi:hypothetical protein GCM10018793_69420 [Streptomyces sulfonofaciens]|uniref:6-methylsalicylate decarboxylase n=1 Tax=Streptomyces sulfonofaciens TaxID=68272 RepID=A0A919LCQ0_9ACTN|nr:amidohydrolase family protein [Streptomyces sulfonofaciens]GHH88721.1 hypothetical protein GCM10018793_69420 [Streptomyces sulfonofaciens]
MPDNGIIDVHAHFTTPRYTAAAKAAGHRRPDGMPEEYWPLWSPAQHLELMDRAGISRSLLSLSSPGPALGGEGRRVAREANEAAAEAVRDHPDRFGLLACLPLPDTEAALDEISHAYDHLPVSGVVLLTNAGGRYFADPAFDDVLRELSRRKAVVLLHPTSCQGHESLAVGRPRPMVEFLFDTARAVVDYVLSGGVQRFPGLRLIVPHAGGVLPLLAERVELFRSIAGEPPERTTVTEDLRSFYYDLAGTPDATQLAALAAVSSPEHLLYGSDYAWTRLEAVLAALDRLDAAWTTQYPGPWRERTTRNARALLDGDSA